MNPVQTAIARVVGLDDVFESQQGELNIIVETMEHLISDNALLTRQIEDLDYLNLFDMNQVLEVLPVRDRARTIARLRRLRHDNPLSKQAVKLVIRFTLGKGVQWVLAEEKDTTPDDIAPASDAPRGTALPPLPTKLVQLPRAARSRQEQIVDATDPQREILQAFWNDSDNKLAFTTHHSMQQMLDDIVTDGEKFYACFTDAAAPYVKVSEIPLEEIVQIIYDPDNRLKPVFYKRQYQSQQYDDKSESYRPVGQPKVKYYWDWRIKDEDQADLLKNIKIPKSKIEIPLIRHVMINEVWTKAGKRGVSELYASREWFRVFREFMEGRASINAAAQAISFVRKVKGGPTAVARFTGTLGGKSVGDSPGNDGSELRKLTKPNAAAIYDSNEAVDLSWMKTDTGAVNAKEDARLLLMSAGAGMGTMVHYFGEGGDANLATAQSMELPMVKSYEDWQQFIEDFFRDWFEFIFRVANGADEDIESILSRIGFTFPPIISQDVVKYTTSWSQIVRDIAPNNMAMRREAIRACLAIMGVPNIDGIMPEIEAEMAAAEAQRREQQQLQAEAMAQMGSVAAGKPLGSNGSKPPTGAVDPNMSHLIAGKGEKVSNGPKSA